MHPHMRRRRPPSLYLMGLDERVGRDNMGIEVKLPAAQMAQVQAMKADAMKGVWALVGTTAGIAGAITFLALRSRPRGGG